MTTREENSYDKAYDAKIYNIKEWLNSSLKNTDENDREIIISFIDLMIDSAYVPDKNRLAYWRTLIQCLYKGIKDRCWDIFIATGKTLGYVPFSDTKQSEHQSQDDLDLPNLDDDMNKTSGEESTSSNKSNVRVDKKRPFTQAEFYAITEELDFNSESIIYDMHLYAVGEILNVQNVSFFKVSPKNWAIIIKWIIGQVQTLKGLRNTVHHLSQIIYVIKNSGGQWDQYEFNAMKQLHKMMKALANMDFRLSYDFKFTPQDKKVHDDAKTSKEEFQPKKILSRNEKNSDDELSPKKKDKHQGENGGSSHAEASVSNQRGERQQSNRDATFQNRPAYKHRESRFNKSVQFDELNKE